jgi:hypothetical protein
MSQPWCQSLRVQVLYNKKPDESGTSEGITGGLDSLTTPCNYKGMGGNSSRMTDAAREGCDRQKKRCLDSYKSWQLNAMKAVDVKKGPFGKLYKDASGYWWSKDRAGHGQEPVKFKVYKETAEGLKFHSDADRCGNFVGDKHKGPIGKFIPWKSISG